MEGRNPPPPASHPFPNSPNLGKFWGTRTAKGFFAYSGVFCGVWACLLALTYFTRESHFLGFEITSNPEELKKKFELARLGAKLRASNVPLKFTNEFQDRTILSTGPDLRFDDGVDFSYTDPVEPITPKTGY